MSPEEFDQNDPSAVADQLLKLLKLASNLGIKVSVTVDGDVEVAVLPGR